MGKRHLGLARQGLEVPLGMVAAEEGDLRLLR